MLPNLLCFEVNLTSVPRHMWWIDSGATTHISVSKLKPIGLSYRKPIDAERYIFVGDGKSVEVKAIGTFRLLLNTSYYLDLNKSFIVQSFRRNLTSISTLDKFGYSYSFGNNKFSFFHDSKMVGTSSLSGYNNLYLLIQLLHLMYLCI